MKEMKIGVVESHFADIVWQNAPLSTRKLVELCKDELNWARTTTYTVLKKLCDRGIFKTENSTVTVLITKDEFNAIQSEQIVDKNFDGSLPAFIAAFTTRKKISEKEINEIKEMIEKFGEDK